MILVLFILVIFSLLYIIVGHLNYWTKKNVLTGSITTMIADNLQIFFGTKHSSVMIQRVYGQYQDVRYAGMYQLLRPILLVKCPELIKEVCVKNFNNFQDHRNMLSEKAEDLWFNNLLVLKGNAWKKMRSIINPSFTCSKMRSMFEMMRNNSEAFTQHFLKREEDIIEVEMKDYSTRYTTSLIANTTLGLKVDSLADRDHEYYKMGCKATNSSSLRVKAVFMCYQLIPTIADFLRIPIFGKHLTSFFINMVTDTIKFREKHCIESSDVLGLLLDERKKQQREKMSADKRDINNDKEVNYTESNNINMDMSDVVIASQLFIFVIGSFETISTELSFMVHELAINPNIQEKLIEEIDEIKSCENVPSYETIQEMEYMDMVVFETLRKWPVNVSTDRAVTQSYTIAPKHPGEHPLHLEKNIGILIPIFSIHRDPKYYKNPEEFDPERFSRENKRQIEPYTYLPFGVGPRFCIGSRFALLAMKTLIFHLLSHFEIVPVEKTQIPLRISKNTFSITAENGFFVGLKKRKSE